MAAPLTERQVYAIAYVTAVITATDPPNVPTLIGIIQMDDGSNLTASEIRTAVKWLVSRKCLSPDLVGGFVLPVREPGTPGK